MSFAGCNDDCAVFFFIDDSVFLINPSAPPAGKIAGQRFRLADAAEPVSLDVSDKCVDPFQSFFVLILPVDVIIPRTVIPQQFHALILDKTVFVQL